MRRVLKEMWTVRRTAIVILAPAILLPLLLLCKSKECRFAYSLGIMVIYWLTEALPVVHTMLLPLFMFPLLGILPVSAVSQSYVQDTSMAVLGCFMLGVAAETSKLHRRLGLKLLMLLGSNPRWLMLAFMLPTWFLSLWMNNTSVTALVFPIVTAVLSQLKDTKVKRSPSLLASKTTQRAVGLPAARSNAKGSNADSDTSPHSHAPSQPSPIRPGTKEEEKNLVYELDIKLSPATSKATYKRICKGMSLCVAYAATIGSTCTLTGTSSNLIMQHDAQRLFEQHGLDSGLHLVSWMVFSLPASAISVLLAWVWLSLFFFGPKEWMKKRQRDKVKDALVKETIIRKYTKLGPVSFGEKAVMVHFVLFLLLCLSRNLPIISGWGSGFFPGFITDSTPAILIALSLFIFPAQRPRVFFWRRHSDYITRRSRAVRALLDWSVVQDKLPWEVIFFLGGGFALANAFEVCNFHRWIGFELTKLGSMMSQWQLTLTFGVIIAMATEVTGTAGTSLLLPFLGQMAVNVGINPLCVLLPCALATSFGFMLPVAAPQNAIMFATGHLQVRDMLMAGLVQKVLCLLVMTLATHTWATTYFQLGVLPPEYSVHVVNTTNTTTTTTAITPEPTNVSIPLLNFPGNKTSSMYHAEEYTGAFT